MGGGGVESEIPLLVSLKGGIAALGAIFQEVMTLSVRAPVRAVFPCLRLGGQV